MSFIARLPIGRTLCSASLALPTRRVEIAVIDTGLADWQSLRDGVNDGTEVVLINGSGDGLAQLALALAGRTGIAAIHLLSHGFPGGFVLGSTMLDSDRLPAYAAHLSAIGACLSDDGEILLYGCRTASGQGPTFLSALSAMTGADVAASYTVTGAASGGGDWDLGYRSAAIRSGIALTGAAMQGYGHTMGPPPITSVALTPLDPGFLRGSGNGGFPLFSTVTTTVGGNFTGAVFQVYNLSGGNEFLTIDGTDVPLADTASTSFDPGNYAVTVTGSTATVTLSGMALDSIGMDTLLNGVRYKNTSLAGSSAGTDEDRSVVLRTVTDSDATITTVNQAATVTINDGTSVTFVGSSAPVADTVIYSGTPVAVHFSVTLPNALLNIGSTLSLTPVVPAGWTTSPVIGSQDVFLGLSPAATYDFAFNITGTGTDTTGSFPISFVSSAAGIDLTDQILSSSVLVDLRPAPVFVSMAAYSDENTIVLTYDRPLDEANPPSLASFQGDLSAPDTVEVNGTNVSISSVAVSGSTVTLVTGLPFSAGDQIVVSYVDPTRGDDVSAIQDGDGNDAASTVFSGSGNGYVVNDRPLTPPSLTATGLTPTYVQGDPTGVAIFSDAVADTLDPTASPGQTITGFTLTVSNVSDAGNETIDGIALTDGGGGLIADGTGTVSILSNTATLTVTGLVSTASEFQTVIDNLVYRDGAAPVTTGPRVVAITSVTDSGGSNNVTTLPGLDGPHGTITVSAASAVTDALLNDTGFSPSDNVTSDPTLTGMGDPNGFVTVTDGINQLGTAQADFSGQWIFTPSLADGPHTLVASETNLASTTTASTPLTFTLDTTPPRVTATLANNTGISSADALTNDPTVTGTAEPNSFVNVGNGVTDYGSGVAVDGSGNWSFTPLFLPDGPQSIIASEADIAGNIGSSATLAFTLDTTAPAAPTGLALDSNSDSGVPTDGITNVRQPTLTGDAEPGSAVVITGTILIGLVPTPVGFGITVADRIDGHWAVTPPGPVPDGTYSVTATATDSAGNMSGPSVPFSVTIDSTAPDAPVVTSPALTDLLTPVITGTAEPDSSVAVTVGGATYTTVATSGAWTLNLATAVPDNLGVLSLVDNGQNSVLVRATDAAGNTSVPFTQTLTIDTTPPAAPAFDSPALSKAVAPVIFGTSEPGATVTVTVGAATYTIQASGGGEWNIDLGVAVPVTGSLSLALNGANLVTATATDAAGNISIPAEQTLTLDTVAPAAPVITSTDLINVVAPVLTGTAEVGSNVAVIINGAIYNRVATDGTWSVDLSTATPDAGSPKSININGGNAVSVTAEDPAGNLSDPTFQTLTIDTIEPVVGITLAVDTGVLNDHVTSNPALTGTGEPGTLVTLTEGSTLLGTTTADGSGAWAFTPVLPDGAHGVTASETDDAGNTGSNTLGFELDTTAPAAPTALALPIGSDGGVLGDGITNHGTVGITGSAEIGSTVQVYVSGGPFITPLAIGSAVAGNDGHWTLPPVGLNADGVFGFTATATDLAGNVSTVSTSLPVTIDRIAPAAPTILSPDLSGAAKPTISGTAETGSTVTVTVGGATYTAGTTAGAWSINLATAVPTGGLLALEDNGTNQLSVTAMDVAGNVSDPAAQTLTIDTTVPAAPVVTSAALTDLAAPIIAGTAEPGAAIEVMVGGVAYLTNATQGGTWSVDLATDSPVPSGTLALDLNGPNSVHVTATDAALNVSPPGDQTLTIDTTAPAAPVITSPDLSDNGTPVITGTAAAGSLVTVIVGGATYSTGATNNGTWSIDLAANDPDSGTLALDVNGNNDVSATATDPAGNVSVPGLQTLVLDTTLPDAPVISSPPLTNIAAPVIAGTAEPDSIVSVTVGGNTYETTATGGVWSIDLADEATDLNVNGANDVSVTAQDLAGNISVPGLQTLTIDTFAPDAPVITSPDLSKFPTPGIIGTAESGSAITVTLGGATYTTTADNDGHWAISLASADPVLGNLELDDNGANLVSVTATDEAGNVSTPGLQTLTLDTTAPDAPGDLALAPLSDSGTRGDLITSVTHPTLTGSGETGATINVFEGEDSIGSAVVVNGLWSVTPEVALAAGLHDLSARQTDPAGNVSDSASLALTIDTSAPASPAALTLAPASDTGVVGDDITNVTRPVLTGTAVPGSIIKLYDAETLIGSGIAGGDGAWSITPATALIPGSNSLTATATDEAGNVSVASAPLAITINGTVVTSTTFTLPATTSPVSLGLRPPTNPFYTAAQLTITVAALPNNGSVTLADGTLTSVGEQLTGAQLTGLLFTPGGGSSGTSAFVYTVTDPLQDSSSGTVELTVGSGRAQITTAGQIPNTSTPLISGVAVPGTPVVLLDNGVVAGSTVSDAVDGSFTVLAGSPLSLGLHRLTVTTTLPGGLTTASAPLVVFVVQEPVSGISTTDFSSADIGAALGEGAKLAFIAGTEAVQFTDATLSVGVNTGEATIQRLYEGLLGRGNDTSGISYWDDQLLAGADKSVVAAGLISSPEYAAAHGTETDTQFVTTLYQGLLGRVADPDGAAWWAGQLANGVSRADVAVGIADADEAKAHLAAETAQVYVPHAAGTLTHELYATGLGREVELAVLGDYNRLYDQMTPSQIAAVVANSAEFTADHAGQDNTAFVNALYVNGLGRPADSGGSAFWTNVLDSGAGSRADVLLGIATSPEAAAHLTSNLSA